MTSSRQNSEVQLAEPPASTIQLNGMAPDQPSTEAALLRQVIDNITQGVVMFDGSCRLLVWNDQYRKVLEFPEEFLQVGRSCREMSLYLAKRGDFGEGDPEVLTAERLKLIWSGNASRAEITTRDEKTYVALVQPTADGGLVITYTDITERKLAEESLRRPDHQNGHEGAARDSERP